MYAEYRSAALAAQLLHKMIQAGMPRPLLDTLHRIVSDELAHASISHDCLVVLGGECLPTEVEIEDLAHPPTGGGLLADVVDGVTHDFCLGETIAVPLFHAMRTQTSHPVARAVLTRVLKDESVHRAFGWDALDALLEMDEVGTRRRIETSLPTWVSGFQQAYADGRQAPPLTPEERGAGLIDLLDYAHVFAAAKRDIALRFQRRGITLP